LGVAVFFAWGNPATAEEEAEKKTPLQIRNYDHFEFDTVTGTYFGFAAFYTEDDKVTFQPSADFFPDGGVDTDNQIFTGEARLLMGGSNIQAGLVIPYHATKGDDLSGGASDVGDVRTHFKWIPFREDLFDFGGGVMVSFPGGSADNGVTTDKVGVLPFLTGTLHAGPVDLNSHIGYQFRNHADAVEASESIFYGGAAKLAVLDQLGLRLELAGQSFKNGEDRNIVAIQPGLDYLINLTDSWDMLLSVAGSYGLTGGTAGSEQKYFSRWGLGTTSGLGRGQWGVGGALGVIWN
jgi:hypothetical protein